MLLSAPPPLHFTAGSEGVFAEVCVDVARADHRDSHPALTQLRPQTVRPGLEGVFAGEEGEDHSEDKPTSHPTCHSKLPCPVLGGGPAHWRRLRRVRSPGRSSGAGGDG